MKKEDTAKLQLPEQEKFFSTEKLRRSARAGTHLPDPTMAPYGYDPKARFNHLFPALELPALFTPGRLHPDDHVSFGSPELLPHHLYRFIENSRGALFAKNQSLERLEIGASRKSSKVKSLDELLM